MKLITFDDFSDLYIKIIQRGFIYILSKLSIRNIKRTKSTFNSINIDSSNWWIIPMIKQRWNKLITGNPNISYEEYISNEIFKEYKSFKIVSIGSGICSHELLLAELNPHWKIDCIDISNKLLDKAQEIALNKKLFNISFICENIYKYELPDNFYDAILFHSSLHHINQIEDFISNKINDKLKPKGKLIINEYVGVNRLQYSKKQIDAINVGIQLIDKKYRKIFKTNSYKSHYYGAGLIRMIISDPSECIDSEKILPAIYKHFNVLIERPLGGNILMNVLKDISHHFVKMDNEKEEILKKIFEFEDSYLLNNRSDFLFGIYEKKEPKGEFVLVVKGKTEKE
ncbi:MAG: class I SAM-dependent methyltransferase [Flavobacteriaceae bacterium]|nr:class I SAM-dependent methyltransferase [Flavobacteriaceae bacterium]